MIYHDHQALESGIKTTSGQHSNNPSEVHPCEPLLYQEKPKGPMTRTSLYRDIFVDISYGQARFLSTVLTNDITKFSRARLLSFTVILDDRVVDHCETLGL